MIFNDPNVFASTTLSGRQFQTPVMVHVIDSMFLCACLDFILFHRRNSLGIITTKEKLIIFCCSRHSSKWLGLRDIYTDALHLMALYNFISFLLSNTLYQFLKSTSIHFKELISAGVPNLLDEMFEWKGN